LPLYPLIQLLPYTQQAILASSDQFNHQLGIVLNVNGEFVAIAVDSLLGERELVLKAFDPIVKVPPYISGCTVLGTGEVVPVLSPDHLGVNSAKRQSTTIFVTYL
jgi:type IV pili sensor histidine kinase/response regulator